MMKKLVLASTSPYRKELLDRLQINYFTLAPEVDETRLPDESAEELVMRLSVKKAQAATTEWPDALVIGSDQVSCNGDRILGKPGDLETAVQQLMQASGKTVQFKTGLCLLETASGEYEVDCIEYEVEFRDLAEAEVRNYLAKENALNCAGSFRCEGLGVSLFKRQRGDDPNSLMGLPLIRLCEMLRNQGVALP